MLSVKRCEERTEDAFVGAVPVQLLWKPGLDFVNVLASARIVLTLSDVAKGSTFVCCSLAVLLTRLMD